jgi:hypothetical protein
MAAARLSPGNSIGICKGLSVTFDATAAVSDTTAAPVARKTSVDLAREVNRLRSSLISAGRDLDAARASAAYWERIARNLVGAVDSQDSESVAACLADARSAIYGEMSEAC